MQQIELQVQEDFLERLANARPVLALSELIWNSLDADASDVRVVFERDGSGLLRAIRVVDDGTGIPYNDAPTFFQRLGGSWKRDGKRSRQESRILHGEEGKGRFRALALGRVVDWNVTAPSAEGEKTLVQYTITINRDRPRQATISDTVHAPATAKRGVEVVVSELHRQWDLEDSESARNELTEVFALYLTDYSKVQLALGGETIDAAAEIARREQFALTPIAVEGSPWVELVVIEWKSEKDRALHLCNQDGFPLSRMAPNVVAPGFSFAAYLKSPYITDLNDQNLLDLAELVPPLNTAVDEAREKLKEHFRARAADKIRDFVQDWKSENVYPYEEEPKTAVEKAQRQVFDVVAVEVAKALPDIQTSEQRTRRFQLRMLRQALERSPEEVQVILTEVLQLPVKKQQELAQLLQTTTLSQIISASKLVADRLDFLNALEEMLFRLDLRARFKERKHLHRLLETNTWIFGEEFALTVSDQSLTQVLRKHRDLLNMHALIDDEPVVRSEGASKKGKRLGIVDLVLSRKLPTPYPTELDHLVIELKAPKKKLSAEDTKQLRTYAFAIARDERFKAVPTRWRFWLVGNDLSQHVEDELDNQYPDGVLQAKPDMNLVLHVRRWSELIQNARGRLQFMQKELNHEVSREEALKRLHQTYAHILGDGPAPAADGDIEDDNDEDSDDEEAGN